MHIITSTAVSMALAFASLGGAVEASAIPLVSTETAAPVFTPSGAIVEQVRMGRHFGHQGGGFDGGELGLGIGIGILGGLLLDNAINNGNYSESSCSRRFRSYDPRTETYQGNDGRRHHCS